MDRRRRADGEPRRSEGRPCLGLPRASDHHEVQRPAARHHGPLRRRDRRGRDQEGAIRVQRRGDRRRRCRGPRPHGRPQRRGGRDGPLSGPCRRLPRHRPHRPGGPELRLPRRFGRRPPRPQEVARAGPDPVGPLHRRAVRPPRHARHHRHVADPRGPRRLRRRHLADQARGARRCAPGVARLRRVLRDQVGRHPAREAGQRPALARPRDVRIPRVDPPVDRRRLAV